MDYAKYIAAFSNAQEELKGDGAFYGKKFAVNGNEGKFLFFVMGVSAKAPPGADYSVSSVFRNNADGKLLPVFLHAKQEGRWQLRSIVVDHFGQAFIAVYDMNGLDGVYPLQDLLDGIFVPGMIKGKQVSCLVSGGISLQQRYELKLAIAAQLGVEPIWTPGEASIADKKTAARRAAQFAEREARAEAEALAKEEADKMRSSKLAALLQRPKAQALTSDGGKRFGIPVCEDGEDEVLNDNSFCIRMNDEGQPVECYIFRKATNGRISRTHRVQVFAIGSQAGGVDISIVDNVVVDLDGEVLEVNIFASLEAVEIMRTKHGLNGGTIVGVRKDNEKLGLYKVTKQKSSLVGHVSA
jgi:hypothetical protein